jgi:integration host factor subunit alpha
LVLKEITDCLERGETVKLSSFGSFVVRKKKQRIGRNPKTGTEVPISPRRVLVFKPSEIFKQCIKAGPPGINADVHFGALPQKAPPPI